MTIPEDEAAFHGTPGELPGSVGLDEKGRLQVRLTNGWVVLSETTVQLGGIVTTRGSGDRLMLLMGSETRDDGEPPPNAEQLRAAVELYRETSARLWPSGGVADGVGQGAL